MGACDKCKDFRNRFSSNLKELWDLLFANEACGGFPYIHRRTGRFVEILNTLR